MLRASGKPFRQEESPKKPFADPVFGQFTFERDLGWKRRIAPGETSAGLVLGSDVEPPSEQMLRTSDLLDLYDPLHDEDSQEAMRVLAGVPAAVAQQVQQDSPSEGNLRATGESENEKNAARS